MYLRDFLSDALNLHGASVAYHVSRRLAELYPSRHVVEGTHYEFEVEDYAAAGGCAFVNETALHNQIATKFDERGKPLTREVTNGWLNVLWRGHLLDVVLITLGDDRLHWIVADDRRVAEEFFRAVCEWAAEVRGEILVFERGYWDKDAELFAMIRGASLDDLVLPAELRDELRGDLKRFFASRPLYERYRIPWKRGVLLTGPPGNGKTNAIKGIVNESGVACLYVKSFKARFESDHTTMRSVFARARAAAPCLLVFEDLDSLLTDNNRSFFLNELDGFAENTGVVVLASTNHPERLDASILDRPSRFDRKFHFGLPAHAERLAYFAAWDARLADEMRLTSEGTLAAAEATDGFSFAYLKEATLSATMLWMDEQRAGNMDAILCDRVAVLCSQMTEQAKDAKPGETKPETAQPEDEWDEIAEGG